MKKFAVVMFCIVMHMIAAQCAWAGTVAINATNFPDKVFRDYVSGFDTNNDKKLSTAEAKAVTSISLYNSGVTSLKGIKYFTALTHLDCSNNKLKTLDLSKNTALTHLDCSNNKLKTLDLSKNTALTYLGCSYNNLKTLDLSKNTALTYLGCEHNKLTSLNVSNCTALTYLDCSYNKLKTLDLSKNTALTNLSCEDNKLTSLNVSKCTALKTLNCYGNKLMSLNVTGCKALTDLNCNNNVLMSLNVGSCVALRDLKCNSNALNSLNANSRANLVSLECYDNSLISLDVTGCYALRTLDCSDNLLAALDVSQCIFLSELRCSSNLLTKLDVSNSQDFLLDWNLYCDDDVKIVRNTKSKPSIPTLPLPYAVTGEYYSTQLIAYGSVPITWTVTGLPSGMTYDDSGYISGTPTKTGTYTLTVKAKNSKGTVSANLKLTVYAPPYISTASLKDGTQNKSYSVTMKATGSKTITWSAGGLPSGLSINKSTGKISGKPKTNGYFDVRITARNAYGEYSKDFWLFINAASSSTTTAQTLTTDTKSVTDDSNAADGPETSTEGIKSETYSSMPESETSSQLQPEDYIIAHVFDVMSRDTAGMYDFDVILSDDIPEGAELLYIANSSEPSDDDEIAEFFDETGKEISKVPESKLITISVWLNKKVIYSPVIAVKK